MQYFLCDSLSKPEIGRAVRYFLYQFYSVFSTSGYVSWHILQVYLLESLCGVNRCACCMLMRRVEIAMSANVIVFSPLKKNLFIKALRSFEIVRD